MQLKVGDVVWYATAIDSIWLGRVTHIPTDGNYEVELEIFDPPNIGLATRPRRYLFTNVLDARNMVRE